MVQSDLRNDYLIVAAPGRLPAGPQESCLLNLLPVPIPRDETKVGEPLASTRIRYLLVTGYHCVTGADNGYLAGANKIKGEAMQKKSEIPVITQRAYNLLAVRDTIDVLSGKWKIPVLCALRVQGKLCFKDLGREIPGISAKVLAQELRELESHELISRTQLNTKPIMVEYQLTEYGQTLEKTIFEMLEWGLSHRRKVTGRDTLEMPSSDYITHLWKELPKIR
jgi:DNA-binding HxlR family transcriptional regulator